VIVTVTFDVDDEERRAIRRFLTGKSGIATRKNVTSFAMLTFNDVLSDASSSLRSARAERDQRKRMGKRYKTASDPERYMEMMKHLKERANSARASRVGARAPVSRTS